MQGGLTIACQSREGPQSVTGQHGVFSHCAARFCFAPGAIVRPPVAIAAALAPAWPARVSLAWGTSTLPYLARKRDSWLVASENRELVRSICAAWERGDYSSAEWAHPEIEYVLADVTEGSGTGLAAMAQGWREFLAAWEEFRGDAKEYREVDQERVLVLWQFRGRGKTSGLDIGRARDMGATLFHVRDGRVTRLEVHADVERLLADLGLEAGS